MRMDRQQSLTAMEVVNTYSEADLARVRVDMAKNALGKADCFIVREREKALIKRPPGSWWI